MKIWSPECIPDSPTVIFKGAKQKQVSATMNEYSTGSLCQAQAARPLRQAQRAAIFRGDADVTQYQKYLSKAKEK